MSNLRPPRGLPLFFVDDLRRPALSEEDLHHAQRVLRLRAGDGITVADGNGRWRQAALGVPLRVENHVQVEPASESRSVVGFALLKGNRNELVVQKLTELGVDEIVLLLADRAVVRWQSNDERRKLDRLRAVARHAGMQSRRSCLPRITGPVDVAAAARRPGMTMAEPGSPPIENDVAGVLVGPEGGWTEAELASCSRTVSLGRHVLRAETAAIAAGVLLGARVSATSPCD
jgi:16S rRNA (uracil1498-N3)-methyltransferase